MKIYKIYFSPTGGTKKVMEIITNHWEGEVVSLDLTNEKMDVSDTMLTQEDIAVIAVPSYGGRVPTVAVERLATLRGNGARAILVCVYGNRAYEDTLVELQDVSKQVGFRTIGAVTAVAEHSIARQFAPGRPDQQDEEQLTKFASEIWKKILDGNLEEPIFPGQRPYKKSSGVGMVPKATKNCVKCGLCAQKCPVQAIHKENPKKVDGKKCISCMRCVAICPYSARKLNEVMLAAVNTMLKKVCSDRKECELFL